MAKNFASLRGFRNALKSESRDMSVIIAKALAHGTDHAARHFNLLTARARPVEVLPMRAERRGDAVRLHQEAWLGTNKVGVYKYIYFVKSITRGDTNTYLIDKAHVRIKKFFKNWRG